MKLNNLVSAILVTDRVTCKGGINSSGPSDFDKSTRPDKERSLNNQELNLFPMSSTIGKI